MTNCSAVRRRHPSIWKTIYHTVRRGGISHPYLKWRRQKSHKGNHVKALPNTQKPCHPALRPCDQRHLVLGGLLVRHSPGVIQTLGGRPRNLNSGSGPHVPEATHDRSKNILMILGGS